MNLEDFNLFKLRSTIFLIMFPLAFTEATINLWMKIVPGVGKKEEEGYNRQDQENIG
jgi:hypothetical protein